MGAIHFSLDEALVRFLKEQLPLARFVETGTFQGDTLEMARHHFPFCESVELSPHYAAKARERFAGQPGIELACGSSPDFLRQRRVQHQAAPVLFWLDAHWCVADQTGGEDSQSPILAELTAIERLHAQSVLLVDDARLYLCAPPRPHRLGDWPDLHAIFGTLLPLSSTHRLMVFNDVLVFYPASIQPAVGAFVQEHGVDWLALARAAEKHQARQQKPWWKPGR